MSQFPSQTSWTAIVRALRREFKAQITGRQTLDPGVFQELRSRILSDPLMARAAPMLVSIAHRQTDISGIVSRDTHRDPIGYHEYVQAQFDKLLNEARLRDGGTTLRPVTGGLSLAQIEFVSGWTQSAMLAQSFGEIDDGLSLDRLTVAGVEDRIDDYEVLLVVVPNPRIDPEWFWRRIDEWNERRPVIPLFASDPPYASATRHDVDAVDISTWLRIGDKSSLRETLLLAAELRGYRPRPPFLSDVAHAAGSSDEPARQDILESAAAIEQSPLGLRFEPQGARLAIYRRANQSDVAANEDPMTRQLATGLARKSAACVKIGRRQLNYPGWEGFSETIERINTSLARPVDAIPGELGILYLDVVELGSFLELDEKLRASDGHSALPLSSEAQRALEDLLRGLAVWIRRYPSIVQLDDDLSRFLSRKTDLKPVEEIIGAAGRADLVPPEDLAVLDELAAAAKRGEFQGAKAGVSARKSVSNLVMCAAGAVATFFMAAVNNNYANGSVLAKSAGALMVDAEASIREIAADFPADLRLVVLGMIKESAVLVRPMDEVPLASHLGQYVEDFCLDTVNLVTTLGEASDLIATIAGVRAIGASRHSANCFGVVLDTSNADHARLSFAWLKRYLENDTDGKFVTLAGTPDDESLLRQFLIGHGGVVPDYRLFGTNFVIEIRSRHIQRFDLQSLDRAWYRMRTGGAPS